MPALLPRAAPLPALFVVQLGQPELPFAVVAGAGAGSCGSGGRGGDVMGGKLACEVRHQRRVLAALMPLLRAG